VVCDVSRADEVAAARAGRLEAVFAGAGEAVADTVLLRRMGIRQEVQGIALLLASDAASFMTGHVHPVDGGAMVGAFGP
jgi:NAD(P)-dependent dehydrogenase (short-subunit alcohol dehydrogenase family)